MNSNNTLMICSLLILALTFIFGYIRWSQLDVVDTYVLIIGTYFGGYTFTDALAKDLSTIDPFLSTLALLLVVIAAGITWFVSRLLPVRYQHALQVRYLATQWAQLDGRVILLLLISTSVVVIYAFQRFGGVSYLNATALDSFGIDLPYWFTSIAPLISVLVFCLSLTVASKVLVSEGKMQILWIMALVIVLVLTALYGRRSIFYILFMLLILWSFVKGRNLFRLRNVFLLLAGLAVLLVFSNIYQSYRLHLLSPTAKVSGETSTAMVPNILEAAMDTEATLSNLQQRTAQWQYNYEILNAQEHSFGVEVPYGSIMGQLLVDAIPRALWPEKPTVQKVDVMIQTLYNLPVTDYPTNDFVVFQADFGYLSIVILPLLLLFVFASMAVFVRATRQHSVLLLLLSGTFLNYLLSVEKSMSFFVLYRNVLILVTIYAVTYAVLNSLGVLRRERGRPALRMR